MKEESLQDKGINKKYEGQSLLDKISVLSSKGDIFYKNQINSVFTARLKKGTEDITNSVPEVYFLWRSVSSDLNGGDIIWNNAHAGMRQIKTN